MKPKSYTLIRAIVFLMLAISTSSCLYIITKGGALLKQQTHEEYDYVAKYAFNLRDQGKVADWPLVVIDGRAYALNYYINKHVALSKSEVVSIDHLPINSDTALKNYGESARGGVLLVTTTYASSKAPQKVKKMKPVSNRKILYVVDGVVVDENAMENINTDEIKTLDVLKDKESVKVYTDEDYEGVILITLKKRS